MGDVLQFDFRTETVCPKCDQPRDIARDFYWVKGKRRETACKMCVKAHANEKQRQRYNNDPEWRAKYNAYQAAYREQHKGRTAPMQKIREQRHKQKNPNSDREKKRRWYQKDVARRLWYGADSRAKKSGLEFTLTREWIQARLDVGTCELTGLPFVASDRVGRCAPFSPSIDRRDNSIGYTPDNCRVIVWALNMGLSEWGEDIYKIVAKCYMERT